MKSENSLKHLFKQSYHNLRISRVPLKSQAHQLILRRIKGVFPKESPW